MFSGIIESIGRVNNITEMKGDLRIQIDADELQCDTFKLGDSIAINGVCLTLVEQEDALLSFDVSNETLQCTNLGSLQKNSKVNLEPALRLSDRINGHIVTGHIDIVAKVSAKESDGLSWRFEFKLDKHYMRYICVKGSVAVDGVSLTVNSIDTNSFSVNIIPYTMQHTLFNDYSELTKVNIEVDMMSRYLERLIQDKEQE